MQSASKSQYSGEVFFPDGSNNCVISWLNLKGADSYGKEVSVIRYLADFVSTNDVGHVGYDLNFAG